jgi:hypothetical protein
LDETDSGILQQLKGIYLTLIFPKKESNIGLGDGGMRRQAGIQSEAICVA